MSSVNYGSKRRVIGASHYGVGDWLVQRATAIVMAIFTLALILAVIFTSGPLTYASWSGIGIVAATCLSVFLFKEHLNAAGVFAIVLIVTGTVLLNVSGSAH